MAAAEYYYGSAGAQALQNQSRPNLNPQLQQQYSQAPPQQLQTYNAPPSYNTPPPTYQQPQGYPSQPPYPQESFTRPESSAAFPQAPPMGSYPPPTQQNGFLGAPLQPLRSHSQPPRVHFNDKKYESDSSYSPSDSDRSTRRHRRKHRHSRSHHHSRDRSLSDDRDRDYNRDYDRDYERDQRHRAQDKEHKNRDTFLGAGGGAIIGDALFPGLGTVGGLLLGGYGGRKHAQKRSKSEAGADREQHHRARQPGSSGWDEGSATYKVGHAVR